MEEFNAVLNQFIKTYHLKKEHPYNDDYFVLVRDDGEVVCDMNPSGHNLLYNIDTLSSQLAVWFL